MNDAVIVAAVRTPVSRGEASEMCAAVGFLASRQAGYATGVALPVDGEISI